MPLPAIDTFSFLEAKTLQSPEPAISTLTSATSNPDASMAPDPAILKSSMLPVLRHRIITNFSAEAEGIKSIDVIKRIEGEA